MGLVVARIRSIKPEFATDGAVRRLGDATALFFILLWNHCDDYGYFNLDTWELAMKTARWRSQDIMRMLRALHRAGMVQVSRGHGVGMVTSWSHQKIDKPRASKWQGVEIIWDSQEAFAETSSTPRRKDRIGKDSIGEERIVSLSPSVNEEENKKNLEKKSEDFDPLSPVGDGGSVETKNDKKINPDGPSDTAKTWRSYRDAYSDRWGAEPPWNAKFGGMFRQLVSRIPAADAPSVAAFYVSHNQYFYVQSKHPVGLLLRDAEKIYTEWKTGIQTTNVQAQQADLFESNKQVLQRVHAAIDRGEI